MELADFDNDGFEDIAVTSRVQNKIYFNDGNNIFTQINMPGASTFSRQSIADFNGDGNLDIYYSQFDGVTPYELYFGDGNRNFTLSGNMAINEPIFNTYPVDFDQDGDVDIYNLNSDTNGLNKFWINDGNANFTSYNVPGDEDASQAVFGDFNEDGFIDYITDGFNTIPQLMYLGSATNTFTIFEDGISHSTHGFKTANFVQDSDYFVINRARYMVGGRF